MSLYVSLSLESEELKSALNLPGVRDLVFSLPGASKARLWGSRLGGFDSLKSKGCAALASRRIEDGL